MVSKPLLKEHQMIPFVRHFGNKKIFAQCMMPIRGENGFRKLDYDYPNRVDPKAMIDKLHDCGFNAFAFVVKDTDGATIAKTPSSWNPSGRDLCQEFSDLCEKKGMTYFLSVTNMNDAYRGWQHPETVSVHFKDGKDHKAGQIATHREGEMRVDIPKDKSLEEMKKRIPFLTDEVETNPGKARDMRGQGYVPTTSFHCPRSEHIDYMITLIKELTKKYKVDGVLADYIRYHHGYTDLCGCPRCRKAFAEKYPNKANKIMKCAEWWDFREDNIVEYGQKFNAAVKSVDEKIVTGWFNLPGPPIYSRRLVAQNYSKLGKTMDCVIPMTYPYLNGTADDGKKWGRLGNIAHWYTQKNMAHRFHEYGDGKATVYCVTNSVECNVEEMLKSCIAYDYGLGISLFKYEGTTEGQWMACKLFAQKLKEQKVGTPAPTDADIKDIQRKVYEKFPPKVPPAWFLKEKSHK